jgi:hypothetical protein
MHSAGLTARTQPPRTDDVKQQAGVAARRAEAKQRPKNLKLLADFNLNSEAGLRSCDAPSQKGAGDALVASECGVLSASEKCDGGVAVTLW